MKKIAYITIGVALLVALFFAGKEIKKQVERTNAIELLSGGYVYESFPLEDLGKYSKEYYVEYYKSEGYKRHLACAKAFWVFNRTSSDRRVKKEMHSPYPSMRVYAYMSNLIRTKEIEFDYLVEQLKFRHEVKYTDSEDYIFERGCFACDVMVYCASGYGFLYGLLPIVNEEGERGIEALTKAQADSLLTIMCESDDAIQLFRDSEVMDILERRVGD
jgi:hypothetical protein